MPEGLRIQWDGLIHLVQMAGGLESLGMSGIIRRNVLRYVSGQFPTFCRELTGNLRNFKLYEVN